MDIQTRTCLGCDGGRQVPAKDHYGWIAAPVTCGVCDGSGRVALELPTESLDRTQAFLIYDEWAQANPFEAFIRSAVADCIEGQG